MFTYIYLNVDWCILTSYVPQEMFRLQISLNYLTNLTKCGFLKYVNIKGCFDMVMVNTTLPIIYKHK